MMKIIKCLRCGKEKRINLKKGSEKIRGKYCSTGCYREDKKAKKFKFTCIECGQEKEDDLWRVLVKNEPKKFCSKKCYFSYKGKHPKEYKDYHKNDLKNPKLNKEVLEKEYFKNKLRLVDIAKKYKLGYATVSSRMKRYNIKTRNVWDYKEKTRNSFSSWQRFLNKEFNNTCQICGWNKTTCDVHHKIHQKNGGLNTQENLILICPNCHRLVHKGLLKI